MSQAQQTAFTLQEILLSISDSLNQAQTRLRDMPLYDQNGLVQPRYELPYLDFNLQVTSSFEETTSPSATGQSRNIGGIDKYGLEVPMKRMRYMPSVPSTHSSTKNQIVSTISGRFVATMPNQGLPQLILNCTTQELGVDGQFQKIELSVLVSNTVSELIPSIPVEFNFNPQKTAALSLDGLDTSEVRLSISEGQTDATTASIRTIIFLPLTAYVTGNTFIVEVNAGIVNKSVSITKI